MRVSSNQTNQTLMEGLRRNNNEYAKVIEQMSSGKRINKISDDPLGSTRLIGFERDEASLGQWQKNIDQLNSRLSRSETYLDSSFNTVLRIQDLTLQAANDSATQADREAIAVELEVLKEGLMSYANAKDDENNYLFSGSMINTPPVFDTGAGVVYQGDNNTRKVPVANGTEIESNVTVDGVFFNGGNFFDDLQAMIDDINGGSATIGATSGNTLAGVERTIEGLGRATSTIGGRMKSAEQMQYSQEDISNNNKSIIGKIRDLDYVETITRANELDLALTTTQKTYAQVSKQSLFNFI